MRDVLEVEDLPLDHMAHYENHFLGQLVNEVHALIEAHARRAAVLEPNFQMRTMHHIQRELHLLLTCVDQMYIVIWNEQGFLEAADDGKLVVKYLKEVHVVAASKLVVEAKTIVAVAVRVVEVERLVGSVVNDRGKQEVGHDLAVASIPSWTPDVAACHETYGHYLETDEK